MSRSVDAKASRSTGSRPESGSSSSSTRGGTTSAMASSTARVPAQREAADEPARDRAPTGSDRSISSRSSAACSAPSVALLVHAAPHVLGLGRQRQVLADAEIGEQRRPLERAGQAEVHPCGAR